MRIAPAIAALMMLPACASLPAQQRPGSVAVVFDAESAEPVIVEGLADRDSGRAVEANDPVRIASISKLVMALAAMKLADEGRFDPYADVSRYLGWKLRNPAFPDAPVTVAQILSHRSGLHDGAGYVIPLGESLEAKLSEPGAWYAEAPPGEAPFEYTNLGSPVVATVLEAASGERYDRLVDRLVFAPLGIDACLNWIGCEPDTIARAVTLYRSTGEVARDDAADLPPNCTFPVAEGIPCTLDGYVPGTNASIFSPQGGVRIGMLDLARLGQALVTVDERVVSARRWGQNGTSLGLSAPNQEDFFCAYALGFQAIQMRPAPCADTLVGDGKAYVGHAGEAYGLRSGLWFDPVGGRGIAYFTSSVPDRTAPDEGGFAPEEVRLVLRAMEKAARAGK
ncbi:beta-lactamase family protein [Qipengyuania gaetbuli]|uniref:serine hydrolase domain-containing protein n=1 Tax=Qipengyuania gaetbuli TaxID=266952 RepID=UPI001C9945B6|nr:serine hydrolase domain-containing protein [Qipengyuania gaetbuli]MBY6014102.1 beta-lactamase family protein [Qipengyuania gaetbuli]